MAFGVTVDGFKIKSLATIKEEIEQRYRDDFGDNIDLSAATPEGQIIAIHADRESELWELAQAIYNSQYPITSEGRQLDNVVAITGTIRRGPSFSSVIDGVARGLNGAVIPAGTIISVVGNSASRFVSQSAVTINIVDGGTFKSGPIELIADTFGEVQANTGTLTVIETPVAGMDSFINESDAILGSENETDPDLKIRRDGELQIAGSATVEAILSELNARPLTTAVIVFQNVSDIVDIDGRPGHSLDIVVLGDVDADIAKAIFEVIGGGIETIGDITENVIDSQGFVQVIKFSRPTLVPIWIEVDITKDPTFYPVDGDVQVENALLAYESSLTVGEDVRVFGTDSLICVLNDILGIERVVIRIGKAVSPPNDNNVVIAPREIADFDSARITVTS